MYSGWTEAEPESAAGSYASCQADAASCLAFLVYRKTVTKLMRMSTPVALQDPAWTLDAAVHIAMRGFWSTLPALARSARRGEDARNMFSKNEEEGFTAPPHWAPTVLAWEDEKKSPPKRALRGATNDYAV